MPEPMPEPMPELMPDVAVQPDFVSAEVVEEPGIGDALPPPDPGAEDIPAADVVEYNSVGDWLPAEEEKSDGCACRLAPNRGDLPAGALLLLLLSLAALGVLRRTDLHS